MIREARQEDAPALAEIYNYYVENTVITFEEEPVLPEEMERRIRTVSSTHLWLVFQEGETILGYAYAGKWRERASYRHSAEATVYLRQGQGGRGLGTALYRELIRRLPEKGVHTLIGGITLPNEASCRLHEKLGFVKTAHFREVGKKQQRWLDVGYWQLILPES